MILSTIALIVLFSSIFILFSSELRASVKFFLNSRKVRIFFPLFLVSLIVLNFVEQINFFIIKVKLLTYNFLLFIKINPAHYWYFLTGKIIFLSLVAFVPIALGKLLAKVTFIKNHANNLSTIAIVIASYIWMFFCILLA